MVLAKIGFVSIFLAFAYVILNYVVFSKNANFDSSFSMIFIFVTVVLISLLVAFIVKTMSND